MTNRPSFALKSGVLLFSVVLAALVVSIVPTPNVEGGGAAMMFGIILLTVVFKVIIEFCLGKWQKRRDEKQKRKESHVA